MSGLDKWTIKHPEWFTNLRFELDDGHNGWDPLINEALQVAEQILSAGSYENFGIVQIKKKAGELRIYFRESGVPCDTRSRIEAAMKKACERSLHVCEICGASASLGFHDSHICVRCASCAPDDWKPIDATRNAQ